VSPREDGFTLVEALVAMAVLAVAGVAILQATQSHLDRVSDLQSRAAALWVAENRLVELGLPGAVPAPEHPARMLGRSWTVDVETAPTDDPDLARVTVSVRAEGKTDVLAKLDGFVDRQAARP
jgi:general secretion pathway protein I